MFVHLWPGGQVAFWLYFYFLIQITDSCWLFHALVHRRLANKIAMSKERRQRQQAVYSLLIFDY